MGDLKGHAIPGSFFLFYGLWWAVGCLRRYMTCKKEGSQFVSTAAFGMSCFQGRISRLPVEGIVKVVLSTAGMLGELLAHLPVPPMGIVQHATMYFFFVLSGVVDITMHYGLPLPPGTDYLSLALALVVEGILFAGHIEGREMLDIRLHMLLVYVIFLTAVVLALEAKLNTSAILTMSRSYLLMLQGSWFWAVGIILYGHGEDNTAWELDSHDSVMQATIYFTWHCAAIFIILFLLTIFFYCYYRRNGATFKNSSMVAVSELGNGTGSTRRDQYGILSITGDDDESDVEFDITQTQTH